MSGIKRKIEDNDPDYEDILLAQNSKRNKAEERNGKSMCSELTIHLSYMEWCMKHLCSHC